MVMSPHDLLHDISGANSSRLKEMALYYNLFDRYEIVKVEEAYHEVSHDY